MNTNVAKAQDTYSKYSKLATGSFDGDPLATINFIEDLAWERHKEIVLPWLPRRKLTDIRRQKDLSFDKVTRWWIRKVSYRRFYLFGLNNTQVNALIEYYRLSPRTLFRKLLSNPYTLVPLDIEKCDSLWEILSKFQGKEPTQEQQHAADIARRIYDNQERSGWAYTPLGALPRIDSIKSSLEDYGITIQQGQQQTLSCTTTHEDQELVALEIAKRVRCGTNYQPVEFQEHTTSEQQQAIRTALGSGITLITGEAGTGKTTIISELVQNLDKLGVKNYVITSFTGKAVARLREVTGLNEPTKLQCPSTLHRLIHRGMRKELEFMIVDEASMITTPLLAKFLRVYGGRYPIVLIGDASQLKPIGWGDLFSRLHHVEQVPRVNLTHVHRSKQQLLKSIYSIFRESQFLRSDSFFTAPGDNVDNIISKFEDPNQFVIISPFRRPLGELNEKVRQRFFPNEEQYADCRGCYWYTGQRVMLTKNLATESLMNGDEGKVVEIQQGTEDITVVVDFPSGQKSFFGGVTPPQDDTDEEGILTTSLLIPSFAITCHKSQGSEWNNVIFFYPKASASGFLNANLVYTALTRAREKIWVTGDIDGIIIGAQQQSPRRYDDLHQKVRSYFC